MALAPRDYKSQTRYTAPFGSFNVYCLLELVLLCCRLLQLIFLFWLVVADTPCCNFLLRRLPPTKSTVVMKIDEGFKVNR